MKHLPKAAAAGLLMLLGACGPRMSDANPDLCQHPSLFVMTVGVNIEATEGPHLVCT